MVSTFGNNTQVQTFKKCDFSCSLGGAGACCGDKTVAAAAGALFAALIFMLPSGNGSV